VGRGDQGSQDRAAVIPYPLVPAEAGTQGFGTFAGRAWEELDSRFRGNERKYCPALRLSSSSIVKQPLANAPPPVLFEAPGRPPSIPLSRGQVSPPRKSEGNGAPRGAPVLRNPRCLLDSAGASRRSIGGVLPCDAGPALSSPHFGRPPSTDRDPLRVAAGSVSRANLGGSASASSWQGVCSAPGRSPASPECRLTRPARGRRIHRGFCTPAPGERAPHLRHRPHPGGSAIRIVSR